MEKSVKFIHFPAMLWAHMSYFAETKFHRPSCWSPTKSFEMALANSTAAKLSKPVAAQKKPPVSNCVPFFWL